MYFNLPRPATELWTPNNDWVTMERDLLLKRRDRIYYGQETTRKLPHQRLSGNVVKCNQ